jgi:hypothetical protein
MSLVIPQPSPQYDRTVATRTKQLIEAEDVRNRKRGADVELGAERLILRSPDGTRYQVVIQNGGFVSGGAAPISGNAAPIYVPGVGANNLVQLDGSAKLPAVDGSQLTNLFGGAWTAYTPTITAGSGAFTTVSATGRWKQLGKIVFVQFKITDTANGTAASFAIATLPVPPAISNSYALAGFDQNTGFLVAGNVSTVGSGQVNIFKYDGSFPLATGDAIWLSGVYEAA